VCGENVKEHCAHLQEITGIEVPTNALYDVQIKRIHEYKRQHLNMFSVINRYLDIKKMSKEERKQVSLQPDRLCFISTCHAQDMIRQKYATCTLLVAALKHDLCIQHAAVCLAWLDHEILLLMVQQA